MKKLYILLILACCGMMPLQAQAQKNLIKAGEKLSAAGVRNTAGIAPIQMAEMSATKGLSAAAAFNISRQIIEQSQLKKSFLMTPSLTPFEQYAPRFIFTISPQGIKNPFRGSGFVFAEQHEGKTVLWGFTAAHIARGMGTDVNVTFYLHGQEYTYPARVVSIGRKYGLNAALIQLPQEVAEVAIPVIARSQLPKPGDQLFTYGFSAGIYKKTLRRVIAANAERVVADFSSFNRPKPGFCGSLVLDAQGKAVGIEVGGYSPKNDNLHWYMQRNQLKFPKGDLSYISEVVPFSRAYDLLMEYRQTGSASRMMLFDGIPLGKLAADEFVEGITVRYADGTYKYIERNPFFSLTDLEKLFPLRYAIAAEVVINKNRTQMLGYWVDLQKREAKRIGD